MKTKLVLISVQWRWRWYSRLVRGVVGDDGKTRVDLKLYDQLIADIGAQGDCVNRM